MKNILIYNDPTVAVTNFVDNLSVGKVHEQAQKMLKFGTLYRIGTTDEVPADRTFRDAWDIDDADLNDGIGGEVKTQEEIENCKSNFEGAESNLSNEKENLSTNNESIELLEQEIAELEPKQE